MDDKTSTKRKNSRKCLRCDAVFLLIINSRRTHVMLYGCLPMGLDEFPVYRIQFIRCEQPNENWISNIGSCDKKLKVAGKGATLNGDKKKSVYETSRWARQTISLSSSRKMIHFLTFIKQHFLMENQSNINFIFCPSWILSTHRGGAHPELIYSIQFPVFHLRLHCGWPGAERSTFNTLQLIYTENVVFLCVCVQM